MYKKYITKYKIYITKRMCICEAGVVGGICGRHGCHFISTANGAKCKNRDSQTSYISRYQI